MVVIKSPRQSRCLVGAVGGTEEEEGTKKRLPLIGVPKSGPRRGSQWQKASLGRVEDLEALGPWAACQALAALLLSSGGPSPPQVTGPSCAPCRNGSTFGRGWGLAVD